MSSEFLESDNFYVVLDEEIYLIYYLPSEKTWMVEMFVYSRSKTISIKG